MGQYPLSGSNRLSRQLPLELCAMKIGEQRMTSLPALFDVDQR
jgi:hypothetical protein